MCCVIFVDGTDLIVLYVGTQPKMSHVGSLMFWEMVERLAVPDYQLL